MLKKAIVFILLVVILGPPIRSILSMGWFRHFHKHHPGKCSVVKKSGIGSEDFQILTSGLTFVSSGLLLEMASPDFHKFAKSKGKGSIHTLDMNNPAATTELKIKHGSNFDRDTFRPHGLSVLEDKVKNEHLVYVINHVMGQADRVEKFRYSPKTKELQHEKSIFSDVFKYTNDLSVLEEDKFYISNWLAFGGEKMMILEYLYHLPLGGLVYYNGTGATVIKDRMFSPNGNILSTDKRYLYLSMPMDNTVLVFKRKTEYDLELVQEATVHTGLDNFHMSENGDALYGGCHPISHKAVKYLTNPAENKAPSQVLRLPLKNGLIVEDEITLEFYDHGDLVTGSSVGGVYKNKLLIGTVADTLVTCNLPTTKQ